MLEISGLESSYIKGANVLHGLNLSVGTGELVGLMGRNGMGKTTLVKTIMGLMPFTKGSIKFLDQEIRGLKPHQISNLGVAYVPQGREIFMDFTVEQNLLLGAIGKKNLKPDFEQAFEHFPILKERLSQMAGTMSGGQQQQLAIARAMMGQPKLLLLDEPSEGIQPNIVHEIAVTLKKISKEQKLTVIVIEQNTELVTMLAERIDFMENGQVVDSVGIDQACLNPAIMDKYLSV